MDRRLLLAILALALLGTTLRIAHFPVAQRTPDERVYTLYANHLLEHGPESTRILVREHHGNKPRWIFPTPIRIGSIYPIAGIMRITGLRDERAAALFSCVCSILTLALLAWTAVRFFHSWVAVGALLFAAVSPMDLAIARRGWQESTVALLALAVLHLCCEITRRPHQRRWLLLFLAVGSYALTVKEGSTWAIYGVGVAWILLVTWQATRSLRRLLLLAAGSLLGLVLGLGAVAFASGGVGDMLLVIQHNTGSIVSNEYALRYQTGPWYALLRGWWLLSPVSLILFLLGAVGVALQARWPEERRWIPAPPLALLGGMVAFVFLFGLIVSVPEHYKNLRYVSMAFPPMFLLVGAGIWQLVSLAERRWRGPAARIAVGALLALLLVLAAVDHRTFRTVFVERATPDLVNGLIAGTQ